MKSLRVSILNGGYLICIISMISIFLVSCSGMLGVSEDRGFESSSERDRAFLDSREPGKCYAKCLIQDKYETYEEELLIYTGEDPEIEGVEYEKIVFAPAKNKWVKKKADKNCRSADPNDCLVWCLENEPEVSESYYVVVDTNLVKEYKVESISYRELAEPGGYTAWKEIICEEDLTERFWTKLQMALISKGYIKADKIMGRATKEALVHYQKSNGLAVGSLTLETLDHLEVDY